MFSVPWRAAFPMPHRTRAQGPFLRDICNVRSGRRDPPCEWWCIGDGEAAFTFAKAAQKFGVSLAGNFPQSDVLPRSRSPIHRRTHPDPRRCTARIARCPHVGAFAISPNSAMRTGRAMKSNSPKQSWCETCFAMINWGNPRGASRAAKTLERWLDDPRSVC